MKKWNSKTVKTVKTDKKWKNMSRDANSSKKKEDDIELCQVQLECLYFWMSEYCSIKIILFAVDI